MIKVCLIACYYCSDTGMAVHKECLEKAKDMTGICLSLSSAGQSDCL